MLSEREPRPRGTPSTGLTRLQSAVLGVMLMAIYLLAYRHGQFGRHGSCQCGQSSASLRGQEELLESMPHSERLMVDCMLEQPDTRTAVRQRLRACLADRGAHPPSDRLSFPPVDPLQQQPGQVEEIHWRTEGEFALNEELHLAQLTRPSAANKT